MLMYSNTAQMDAPTATTVPQRPSEKAPGTQRPRSRVTAYAMTGRAKEMSKPPVVIETSVRYTFSDWVESEKSAAMTPVTTIVVRGSREPGVSRRRRRDAGSTSARANDQITREADVWMASRLAVNPMMKSTKSGLVMPEPSCAEMVSATGSATSPLSTRP